MSALHSQQNPRIYADCTREVREVKRLFQAQQISMCMALSKSLLGSAADLEPAHSSTLHFYLGLCHESWADTSQWHDDRLQNLQASLQCLQAAASCLPPCASPTRVAWGETTRNFSWPLAGPLASIKTSDAFGHVEPSAGDDPRGPNAGRDTTEPYYAKDAANERAIARLLSNMPKTSARKSSASASPVLHEPVANDRIVAARHRYDVALNDWRGSLRQYIQAVEALLEETQKQTAASDTSVPECPSPSEDLLAAPQFLSRMEERANSRSIIGNAKEPEQIPLPQTPSTLLSPKKSSSRLPLRSTTPCTPTRFRRSPMAFRHLSQNTDEY